MADTKLKLSSKTNLTITLASLVNTRQSTAVDNTTDLYLDALVGGFITAGASGVAATGVIYIYAYGSLDGGATYSDGATGTDGSHTNNKNAPLLGAVALDANGERAEFGPFSVASAFGGFLPDSWGVIVENRSNATLNGTGSNHEIHYRGVTLQSV